MFYLSLKQQLRQNFVKFIPQLINIKKAILHKNRLFSAFRIEAHKVRT